LEFPWNLVLGICDFQRRLTLARSVLKRSRMHPTTDLFGQSQFRTATPNFWERILNDDQLQNCNDLEKLLVGCEIIAALDGVDLLAA
jgi:hypothetical protein